MVVQGYLLFMLVQFNVHLELCETFMLERLCVDEVIYFRERVLS